MPESPQMATPPGPSRPLPPSRPPGEEKPVRPSPINPPPRDTVTVHIEDVLVESITHVLLAIEDADHRWFDAKQHESVTNLVLGLRAARDQ